MPRPRTGEAPFAVPAAWAVTIPARRAPDFGAFFIPCSPLRAGRLEDSSPMLLRPFRHLLPAVLLGSSLMLGACGTAPTYINIPAQPGDMARHDPNSTIIRRVVTLAGQAIIQQTPITGPVIVTLPTGTTRMTYAAVLPEIGDLALDPDFKEAEIDTFLAVSAVRLRGDRGQIDLVRTLPGQPPQLVTVSLRWMPISGWHSEQVRTWRGPVPADTVLPEPPPPAPIVPAQPEPTAEPAVELDGPVQVQEEDSAVVPPAPADTMF